MDARIVVHFSEIGIKGKNRRYFEEALARNIRTALGPLAVRVRSPRGRMVCEPAAGADLDEISRRLKTIPGIAHFSVARAVAPDMALIEAAALAELEGVAFHTFGVKARRADKSFPLNSAEIGAQVGAAVLRSPLGEGKKVDLSTPDVWLLVELTSDAAYIYRAKVSGPGGLPLGTAGKVLASLSGGLDSPVAAWMLMKRGCEVVFVHIRNETQFAGDAVAKIEELVTQLTRTQLRSRLYIVPFGEVQRHIIAFVPAKERMIVYRRFMMKILNRVAEQENALALVTGDSVGQVASQTLDNLLCIQDAARLPVLSPLIGMNKEEVVDLARRIGTYESSILPYPDCCSFMIAPHPETRAELPAIKLIEAGIDNAEKLVEEAVAQAEVKTFRFP